LTNTHLFILQGRYSGRFRVRLVTVNVCLQQELLKSDSICQSYAQMKKGPVFLTHSVYMWPGWPHIYTVSQKMRPT